MKGKRCALVLSFSSSQTIVRERGERRRRQRVDIILFDKVSKIYKHTYQILSFNSFVHHHQTCVLYAKEDKDKEEELVEAFFLNSFVLFFFSPFRSYSFEKRTRGRSSTLKKMRIRIPRSWGKESKRNSIDFPKKCPRVKVLLLRTTTRMI